jgi:hypothetical protein
MGTETTSRSPQQECFPLAAALIGERHPHRVSPIAEDNPCLLLNKPVATISIPEPTLLRDSCPCAGLARLTVNQQVQMCAVETPARSIRWTRSASPAGWRVTRD